jgi:hypothetical protein
MRRRSSKTGCSAYNREQVKSARESEPLPGPDMDHVARAPPVPHRSRRRRKIAMNLRAFASVPAKGRRNASPHDLGVLSAASRPWKRRTRHLRNHSVEFVVGCACNHTFISLHAEARGSKVIRPPAASLDRVSAFPDCLSFCSLCSAGKAGTHQSRAARWLRKLSAARGSCKRFRVCEIAILTVSIMLRNYTHDFDFLCSVQRNLRRCAGIEKVPWRNRVSSVSMK